MLSSFREEEFENGLPIFQLVTPLGRASFESVASYEPTWKKSTRRCFIPNIKAIGLPVLEKKNFVVCYLCSYVPTCDPGAGPVLIQGASYEQLGRVLQGDAIYKISNL